MYPVPFAFRASFIILSSFLFSMQAVAPTLACTNSAGGTQKYRETFAPALQNVFSLIFFSVRKFNLLLQAARVRMNATARRKKQRALASPPTHVSC
jgi:hypothetical protein